MANTIINFKRGNGLNIMDPNSNPTGLPLTTLNPTDYSLATDRILNASPWFNTTDNQFWVDGVCINPALVPGKGISLGDLEWDEDINNNPTSKLINTIDVKLSAEAGNSLSMKDDGLYLAAAEAGVTMIYRFNSIANCNWISTSTSPQQDASALGNMHIGVVLQGGTQTIQENDDGTTDIIETWGALPTSPYDAPFNFSINGNIKTSAFYYDMPGLTEYQTLPNGNIIDKYQYGYTFQINALNTDSTGNTNYGVTNLTIPKNIILKTPNEETYTFYSGTNAIISWTIPTEAERFAKSMNIVPITIDAEGNYWDMTTIEGDEGDEDYVGPTQVTVDNSNNVIGQITTGANVIRLEVANADGDSPHYLYLGIEGLFSYKTLSATDHLATGLYVINGSGYTQSVNPLVTLREDGSWQTIPVFGGATASTDTSTGIDGTSGLVPAPVASEANYVLRGDGTWAPLSLDALNYTTDASTLALFNNVNIKLNNDTTLLHWWNLRGSKEDGHTNIDFNVSTGTTYIDGNPINYPTIELMIDVIDGGSF